MTFHHNATTGCIPRGARLATVLSIVIATVGCGDSRPNTVKINGNVTLNGGHWPGPGVVAFRPLKPAEGFMSRPAHGQFDRQGAFTASTYENGDGLVPGQYEVLFIYEDPADNPEQPPKMLIEARDQLDVPADAGPALEYVYDVKR